MLFTQTSKFICFLRDIASWAMFYFGILNNLFIALEAQYINASVWSPTGILFLDPTEGEALPPYTPTLCFRVVGQLSFHSMASLSHLLHRVLSGCKKSGRWLVTKVPYSYRETWEARSSGFKCLEPVGEYYAKPSHLHTRVRGLKLSSQPQSAADYRSVPNNTKNTRKLLPQLR